MGENLVLDARLLVVNTEGEHDHDTSWTCSDREGKGVEGLLPEAVDFFGSYSGKSGLGFFRVGGTAVLLIEEIPGDHCDDDASGDLNDGKRDAEEAEQIRTNEFDNGEEDDGIDGDAACEPAKDVYRSGADETEEDECRAEGVDEWGEGAESQREVFPD